MKTKKLSALAAITATAALLASATPALAEHEGPIPARATALMSVQDELHKIAKIVGKGNGFSGFYVDAAAKTLNVHWKGKPPAKVGAAAAVAKAQGLIVKVHPAKYSRAELDAEAARLLATGSIQGIGAKHDGSGLRVTRKVGLSAQAAVPVRSTVPIDLETGTAELAASRYRDTSPYKGGGFISYETDGRPQGACSTGFAVIDNASNRDGLLTAVHCGWLGTRYHNGAGQLVGEVGNVTYQSDAAIIFAAAEPKVWIGDSIRNEANQYGLDVVGAAETLPGDFVCTSGAFSGTICDIRVTETGLNHDFPGWGLFFGLAEAVHTGGYSAGGNGDSGGPVFSVRQPGDKLVARGTLTAFSTRSSDIRQCSGVPAEHGRKCSQRILFPDITDQLRNMNAKIKTIS